MDSCQSRPRFFNRLQDAQIEHQVPVKIAHALTSAANA
jgi:hypothetical protein